MGRKKNDPEQTTLDSWKELSEGYPKISDSSDPEIKEVFDAIEPFDKTDEYRHPIVGTNFAPVKVWHLAATAFLASKKALYKGSCP